MTWLLALALVVINLPLIVALSMKEGRRMLLGYLKLAGAYIGLAWTIFVTFIRFIPSLPMLYRETKGPLKNLVRVWRQTRGAIRANKKSQKELRRVFEAYRNVRDQRVGRGSAEEFADVLLALAFMADPELKELKVNNHSTGPFAMCASPGLDDPEQLYLMVGISTAAAPAGVFEPMGYDDLSLLVSQSFRPRTGGLKIPVGIESGHETLEKVQRLIDWLDREEKAGDVEHWAKVRAIRDQYGL